MRFFGNNDFEQHFQSYKAIKLSITEEEGGNHRPYPCQEASLLDFDDDPDDHPGDIDIRSLHDKKLLSSESQDDFYCGYSPYTRNDSTENSLVVGVVSDPQTPVGCVDFVGLTKQRTLSRVATPVR